MSDITVEKYSLTFDVAYLYKYTTFTPLLGSVTFTMDFSTRHWIWQLRVGFPSVWVHLPSKFANFELENVDFHGKN